MRCRHEPRARPGGVLSGAVPAGFTLLEMVIVLVIIATVFVAGIVSMRGADNEKELREPMLQVEGFSKSARSLSMIQRRPYQIYFNAEGMQLDPFGEADFQVQSEPLFAEYEDEDEIASDNFSPVSDFFAWPEGLTMSIRGWNGDWIELRKSAEFVWIFEPDELVEPVSFRIEGENGWIEQEFNPLTGAMAEERFEIR